MAAFSILLAEIVGSLGFVDKNIRNANIQNTCYKFESIKSRYCDTFKIVNFLKLV